MPVKSPPKRSHHVAHKKEKRTKRFMKVYAPYIPLLTFISAGIILTSRSDAPQPFSGQVKSYATNTSSSGLLEETNKRRQAENLQPLALNASLTKAAQTKAEDMRARNYWSHNTPDGKEPWEFIQNANYSYLKAAENLAYGFDNSNSTLNGWMNSPGHRANVMDPALKEVGFGMANAPNYQNHGEETIVVAMYGTPAVASAGSNEQLTAQPSAAPAVNAENNTKKISYIQSLANGKAPWASFAAGIIIGLIAMYLLVTHARGLRRALSSSERFVIKHPLFDVTLVALLTLMAIASQTVGTIH